MTSAAGRTRWLAIAGVLLASGLVHLVTLAFLPRAIERRAPVEVTAIALELNRAVAPQPRRDVQRDAAAIRVPPGTTQQAVPLPRSPRSVASRPADIAEPAEPTPAAQPEPITAPPPAAHGRRVDIAPRAAAIASLATATESVAEPRRNDLAVTRSDQLSSDLKAIANANPARDHRAPELVRDPDGTCHYAGDAINATILPDGGVRFEDKPPDTRAVSVQPLARGQLLPRGGAKVPPPNPVTPEEQLADQRLELRVQVTGRAWKAERDWFLRETQDVRRELADAAHARELAAGEHELRKRLDRIWCDTNVPVTERRGALFAVWDEMSADEVGARGRRVVLEYVRENLPKGSAQAFPEQQLAQLNLGRGRGERFEPYTQVDAAPEQGGYSRPRTMRP